MVFGNEIWLAASWLAGGGLCLVALRGAPLRRLLRRTPRPDLARVAATPLATRTPKPFTGKVYVIDGDTIHVRQARVRLFGMDAPELSQRGGAKARSHLIGMAGGREVSVEPVDVDRYGRIVARVRLGGIDLSERMVIDGYARAMSAWHPDYVAVEKRARLAQRGLWAGDPVNGIGDPAAHRRAHPR